MPGTENLDRILWSCLVHTLRQKQRGFTATNLFQHLPLGENPAVF